jgi:cytochrome P450
MLKEIREDPLRLLDRMMATGEPMLRYRVGPFRQVAVFDAEMARYVLSVKADQFPRPFLINRVFQDVAGANLFTSTGAAWSWRRKAMQPAFQRAPIERLAPAIEAFVESELAKTPPGPLDDIQSWFASLTIQVAASAMFSRELSDRERDQLDVWFREIASWVAFATRVTVPLPAWVPTARNRRMRATIKALHSWLAGLIAERRQAGVGEADVFDGLLSMTDPSTGKPLPDKLLVAEAMALLFAGYETTSAAATWATAFLSERPDLQSRLAEGEDGLVARVVDETLRLRPPGWGALRMASQTDEIGGYRVGRFTGVLISIYSIHRNPAYWPDPERFDPDRFLPDQLKTRPANAFMPFSVGPRHCIGMRLAQLELRLIVEHLCRRFEIAAVGSVETDAGFALRVRGALPLNLSLRAA